MGFIC